MDTPTFFREARELNTQLEQAFRGLAQYAGASQAAAEARETLRQQGRQLRYALGTDKFDEQNLPDPFRVNEVCIQAFQLVHELEGSTVPSTANSDLSMDDLPNAPERERMSLRERWEQWTENRRTRQPISLGLAPAPAHS